MAAWMLLLGILVGCQSGTGSSAPPPTSPSPSLSPSPVPYSNPGPWIGAGAAYDAERDRVVMFGGFNPDVNATERYSAHTWTWDGKGWLELHPSLSPAPREHPAMAWDGHHQVVLFGGVSPSSSLSDTWIWDGKTWSEAHPTTSPPAFGSPALVFDEKLGMPVLVGVQPPTAVVQTWTWDGATWHQFSTPQSPKGFLGYEIETAYQPSSGRLVLYGWSGGGKPQTWTFDATTWSLEPAQGPDELQFEMAAHEQAGQVVLFGPAGVTWLWDGKAWTRAQLPVSPSGRQEAAIAYDAGRKQVVMYGGARPFQSDALDTWAWDGQAWAKLG